MGGLLMWTEGAAKYVYAYDGNGNVVSVMNRAGGATVAEYEYTPFGEPLRATGAMAQTNPFRFSTKYTDNDGARQRGDGQTARFAQRARFAGARPGGKPRQTGLLWYGYRYYSPSTGRFLGRDTIGEEGGLNLYAFCGNNGINGIDYLGQRFLHETSAAEYEGMTFIESGSSNGLSFEKWGYWNEELGRYEGEEMFWEDFSDQSNFGPATKTIHQLCGSDVRRRPARADLLPILL